MCKRSELFLITTNDFCRRSFCFCQCLAVTTDPPLTLLLTMTPQWEQSPEPLSCQSVTFTEPLKTGNLHDLVEVMVNERFSEINESSFTANVCGVKKKIIRP